MSVDYSGGILIGCHGSEIKNEKFKEDSVDFVERHNLDIMRPYYDASPNESYIGKQIHYRWSYGNMVELVSQFKKIKERLEPLLGTEVYLIGTQDIT